MRPLRAAGDGLGLLLAWQALVWATGVPPFILPGPLRVGGALWHQPALLLHHAGMTLTEILLGMVLGSLIGVASAIVLAASRTAARWLLPLLVVSQALPVFALAPLLVLWLGYGMASKVAMAVLIIYFPVTAAFLDGLRRTEPGWLELARTMDARPAGDPGPDPGARGPAGAGLGPAGRRRRGADRGRDRRVGRLQRRPRLPDAARQRPHAGRPHVRRPAGSGRHGAGAVAAVDRLRPRLVPWQPERFLTCQGDDCGPSSARLLLAARARSRPACRRWPPTSSPSMLDWFVNPDHGPLIIAAREGLLRRRRASRSS